MTQFTWMARDEHSSLRSGLIDAPSAGRAAARLRHLSMDGLAVLPLPVELPRHKPAGLKPAEWCGVSLRARMEAISHLRMLIGQGVPPGRACAVAGASAGHATLSEALHNASFHMRQGGGLAEALATHRGLLGPLGQALIHQAELRGALPEGLKSLYQLLEFEEQMEQRREPRGWRRWGSRLRMAKPVSPVAERLLVLTHFFGCLALGQQGGLSLAQTLRGAQDVCGDAPFKREVAAVRESLDQQPGQSLAKALDEAGLLPLTSRQPLEQAQAEERLTDVLVDITRELRSHAEAALAA